jgi:hypothetical protein
VENGLINYTVGRMRQWIVLALPHCHRLEPGSGVLAVPSHRLSSPPPPPLPRDGEGNIDKRAGFGEGM